MDVAAAGRDDAGRHRAAEAEGIADRQYPIADPGAVGIAKGYIGQGRRRADLEQGQVRLLVGADDLRRIVLAVGQRDLDVGRVIDHVVVGYDVARRIDDEARAEGGHILALVALSLPEMLEELLEG